MSCLVKLMVQSSVISSLRTIISTSSVKGLRNVACPVPRLPTPGRHLSPRMPEMRRYGPCKKDQPTAAKPGLFRISVHFLDLPGELRWLVHMERCSANGQTIPRQTAKRTPVCPPRIKDYSASSGADSGAGWLVASIWRRVSGVSRLIRPSLPSR